MAQYLFKNAKGRKSGSRLSGGHFIGSLAHHFSLVSDDGLRGLSVVARELPLIKIGKLVKLNIYMEKGDDWAWVAPGLERQQDAATSAPKAAEDALAVDEGNQAVLAPVQAPQQPPPPPPPDAGIQWDLIEELTCSIPEMHQAEDWRGQNLHNLTGPTATKPMIPLSLSFCFYLLIKPGSKFSTIVQEYVTEPSMVFTPKSIMEKRDDFKCVEVEEKSNLKTSL
ncbi:hypothetical protein Tco_0276501 [Tanacetum coccineum]